MVINCGIEVFESYERKRVVGESANLVGVDVVTIEASLLGDIVVIGESLLFGVDVVVPKASLLDEVGKVVVTGESLVVGVDVAITEASLTASDEFIVTYLEGVHVKDIELTISCKR
jgi:hypothetical protein